MTQTWFSRDDAIVMCSILVNAILQTLSMSNFTNTCWVVDLGDVTSGGGSTSTHFVNILASCRNNRTRKLASYAS